MLQSRAAKRYAKALIELAAERDTLQQVDSDMRHISKSIDENPELRHLLQNPIINTDVKKDALMGYYGDLGPLSLDTVRVLVENKRIELLQDVADQYIILFEQLKQEDVAEVTTVPFTVGGGISDVKSAELVLSAGANKVSTSSAAFRKPELVEEMVKALGAEKVTVAIDAAGRDRLARRVDHFRALQPVG